jgi:ABC-2 type transport system permease protein
MNPSVILAIFRRNLNSYLNTPTGYVFICLFVLLCSAATFCLPEFFNANLANLDQLNKWIAPILLIFIPAITMSIWAEERRQGTDELLLTIPASDLDVVLGKFLAATGIYTISLFFTMLCNFIMLMILSKNQLDFSLFLVTFFGYWLMGEAMLSIGMIASFLTNNLTVSYILGMILNMPLVILQYSSEGQINERVTRALREWSLTGQFEDFGRGVFNFSSVIYFVSIIVLALYLGLVLIGRRHWSGGRDGHSMGGHYFLRFCGLLLAAVGINMLFGGHGVGRADLSADKINSLSKQTYDIVDKISYLPPEIKKDKSEAELSKLLNAKAVRVEAYFSPNLPESYMRQRLTIERFLREMESNSKGMLVAQINTVEPNTDLAYNIEQKYDITPNTVQEVEHSVVQTNEIYMGLAFTSGRNKQVIRFFERDLPVEYELARSIWAVTQSDRKKLGILVTDANLMGSDMEMRMQQRRASFRLLVQELKKIYDVSSVDANAPITLKDSDGKPMYDVLLAVQPSTLGPTAMRNFVDAVRQGQATVIFEDPHPLMSDITGTYAERRPRPNQFGMPQPPEPKGNIQELWNVLGVEIDRYDEKQLDKVRAYLQQTFGNQGSSFFKQEIEIPPQARDLSKILYSTYVPDKQLQGANYPLELMFICTSDETADEPFNPKSPITGGLNRLMLPFAGTLAETKGSKTKKEYLARTGKTAGTIQQGAINLVTLLSQRRGFETQNERVMLSAWETPEPTKEFVVAYQITGTPSSGNAAANLPLEDEGSPEKAKQAEAAKQALEKQAPGAHNIDPAQLKQVMDAMQAAKGKDSSAAAKASATLNVAILSDLDLINDIFFQLRGRKEEFMQIPNDNVPFVLNMIDGIAGQQEFLEIRKRGVRLRPLVLIDELTNEYAKKSKESEDKFRAETNAKIDLIRKNALARIKTAEDELQAIDQEKNPGEYEAKAQAIEVLKITEERKAQSEVQSFENSFVKEQEALKRQLNKQVASHKKFYQWMSVIVPPILPLIVAFFVFFTRLSRETEGVGRSRLR